MILITSSLPVSKLFVKFITQNKFAIQSSELLETGFSVLKSVFCTPRAMLVCTLGSDIIIDNLVPRCRASSPGNPHSERLRGQGPLPRTPHVPTAPQSGSQSTSLSQIGL